jgi:hypothetical protein
MTHTQVEIAPQLTSRVIDVTNRSMTEAMTSKLIHVQYQMNTVNKDSDFRFFCRLIEK